MPRLPRLFMPGQAHHVILRGNNKQPIFFEDSDRALFLDYLADGLAAEGCALFAYVLMTNHVHLLLSAEAETGIPRLMQSLGRRYVGYVNRAYGRTGTLWEGRYKSTIVDSETYVLACHRYIEANPLRARMVRRPEDHLWSSYRAHALGRPDRLLTEHPTYTALGITRHARQAEYRALFELGLDEAMLATLRDATNQGWIPGSDRFRREIAAALGRRVTPPRRGRPPKERPAVREEGEGRLI